jgi:hypothetical protein
MSVKDRIRRTVQYMHGLRIWNNHKCPFHEELNLASIPLGEVDTCIGGSEPTPSSITGPLLSALHVRLLYGVITSYSIQLTSYSAYLPLLKDRNVSG